MSSVSLPETYGQVANQIGLAVGQLVGSRDYQSDQIGGERDGRVDVDGRGRAARYRDRVTIRKAGCSGQDKNQGSENQGSNGHLRVLVLLDNGQLH